MTRLSREGVDFYYEHHPASQDQDNLPTILFSHGYSATSQMWRGQLEALSGHASIIVWDMRGHGESDSPEDQSLYSEEHTVQDMAAILDACEVDSAIIAGLSLGGYMSLAFNVAFPDRVEALMLFDTGPGYKNDKARQGWNRMAAERGDQLEAKGLSALGSGNEVRIAMHRSAEGLARAARGMLAQVDDRIIQSLPDISVPTLVLVGEKDETFLAPTDYMAAKIPGARKVIIDGAGHAANIDQPEAFNAAVIEFIESLDR
jgi:pimeloyl-ACP methyl ester carboxylesterase